MKKQLQLSYHDIVSLENLLLAWKEFRRGKRTRKDVQEFQFNLMHNLIKLHQVLFTKTYRHSSYEAFNISDPKPRNIHKAQVRDRILHHAIYRQLYSFFDKIFIHDSYSCRIGKGTHKAINRFRTFAYKVSNNYTRTAWVLKCDIRKFFASVDHAILMNILKEYIIDKDTLWLLEKVIDSFPTPPNPLFIKEGETRGVGLPLGNLTSQLLVNIYMNKFDQFVKHQLKARYYIRYADDFIILSSDEKWLHRAVSKIQDDLLENLKLQLHPNKISIKTITSSVDYLGWVHFPDHRTLRTSTKRRMLRNIKIKQEKIETIQSYLGLLKHGNTTRLKLRAELTK